MDGWGHASTFHHVGVCVGECLSELCGGCQCVYLSREAVKDTEKGRKIKENGSVGTQ